MRYLVFLLLLICVACQTQERRFELRSPSDTGIDFTNQLTPTLDLNILTYLYYYNGAGIAVADFNQDGLNDIYLTSNQGADKLYLNQGGLVFKDISATAGINNADGWTTGVTHIDINQDGLLDLYVCKVGAYKTITGKNLLYVNQGNDELGRPVFKEDAKSYGLDIVAFSTQSAFFDYDLDGDLDMYLLNHSVHPNGAYGKGQNRSRVDSLAGDRLLENVNGHYQDVSSQAGLFQGRIGYGLGLAIGDVNRDGFPDIYVGNDFFENDYFYINNGDKTFSEVISNDPNVMGHTSHYSMGNSMSDVNNDGNMDILSLDMLPENLETLKSSGVEDPYPTYDRYLKNGYAPQYMQNTLHLNRGNQYFSEVGFQSGIAATEWSWGVLSADLDMDGHKDLYISNGILGATNDMDYINFIAQEQVQKEIESGEKGDALRFIENIPAKKVSNYAYKNKGGAIYSDVSDLWFVADPSYSNGSVASDLDNDGDLDLVINNVNQSAFVYENHTNDLGDKNFVKINFQGIASNNFGIGAKVELYAGDLYIYEEHFPVKSYLSTAPTELVIALGDHNIIDSLRITWPNQKCQMLYGVATNSSLLLKQSEAEISPNKLKEKPSQLLTNVEVAIDFVHKEEPTLDFDRDPLVPYALSNEGPAIEIGDINGDGLDDLLIGGAKRQASRLYLQNQEGNFTSYNDEVFESHVMSEDTDQLFFDVDGDGDLDLLVVSGGNEYTQSIPMQPRLYRNELGNFKYDELAFAGVFVNASVVQSIDIENDGDLDIIICANALSQNFGDDASNYLFRNDGSGQFEDISSTYGAALKSAGLINALKVVDIDKNGRMDMVAAGAWMPLTFLKNDGQSLTAITIPDSEGWWQSLEVADFDQDGDLDLVGGNWGQNTRLKASKNEPITLYRSDFDKNGNVESVVTYFYKGQETLLASKNELSKQMPFINKNFLSYHSFASAKFGDIFPSDKLKNANVKSVKELSTAYFENLGNEEFKCRILPFSVQQSVINDMLIDDFNDDGYDDLLMVGNRYELSTQLGRLDASHGVLLINDQQGFFTEHKNQGFNISGPARDIEKIIINGQRHYVVAINNGRPIFLQKNN